ncbi:MAG TPA: glycosyltransferase family 2 protein, partial [Capsulimonadaceae bacterium]|nr:glycosyltransferase family 2 protein [Capsulimonadaceae bacterium]
MGIPAAHLHWNTLYALHMAVLVFAALLSANTLLNVLFFFRRPRAAMLPDHELPTISVLVPARNEERHIEACVRSLLASNYPRFEIVVLDDNSEDSTYEILCRLRDQDHRLRVLIGAELPEGWCGKPFACWQLAQAAQGDYLLFTDADCRFSPDALMLAIGAQVEHNADVVSLMPNYERMTFWEKLLLPLLAYIPLAFLPMGFVRGAKHPWFSGANGAFLFMTREVYFDLDGHRAVRTQLAEDIKFSQHVKRQGRTMWYGDGHRAYSVRMYEGLPEIWRGFTRNLYPAFSHNLGLLLVVLVMVAVVFVLPIAWTGVGLALHEGWAWIVGLTYLLTVAMRLAIAVRLEWDDLFYSWL